MHFLITVIDALVGIGALRPLTHSSSANEHSQNYEHCSKLCACLYSFPPLLLFLLCWVKQLFWVEYALQGAAAHIGHLNATRGSIPTNSPIVQFDATLIQSPSIYIQLFSRSLVRHSSFFISNISPMKNCTDLNLGEGLCIFTSFHFPCFSFPPCTWEHPRLKIPSVYMHKPYFNFK